MSGNGEHKPTSAPEWVASTRKTVVCPSGRTAVIREIVLEDYFPLDLIASGLDYQDGKLPPDAYKQHIKEHSEEIKLMTNRALYAGMVEPRVYEDPGPGQLGIADLGRDRNFLSREILKFSGLTDEAISEVDSFRKQERERAGAGDGGPVLRETAAPTPPADPAAVAPGAPVLPGVGEPTA